MIPRCPFSPDAPSADSLLAAPLLLLHGKAPAIDPIGRTRPSHLKLSLAAYSYRQFLQGPEATMDLFAFADLAADMGLDAIEPTSYYFPKDVDAAYLHKLKLHAFRLGLDISGTAVGNDFGLEERTETGRSVAPRPRRNRPRRRAGRPGHPHLRRQRPEGSHRGRDRRTGHRRDRGIPGSRRRIAESPWPSKTTEASPPPPTKFCESSER